MLSKVNHKNFVNLIGYCEEEAPFSRMMVFEYAPNGTLFEHLHGKYLTSSYLSKHFSIEIIRYTFLPISVAYLIIYRHRGSVLALTFFFIYPIILHGDLR